MDTAGKRAFVKEVMTTCARRVEKQMEEANKMRVMFLTASLQAEIATDEQLEVFFKTASSIRGAEAAATVAGILREANAAAQVDTFGELP